MAVVVGIMVCVVTVLVTIVIFNNQLKGDEDSLALLQFSELEDLIDDYYLYDYDIKDAQDAALKAMVASLDDPYTTYYTKEEFDAFNQSSEGEYEGLGMLISEDKDTGDTVIIKFFDGSSAQEAGVMVGDVIINLAGVDVRGMSLEEVSSLSLGESGTLVKLGVLRDGQEYYYELERRAIIVDMLTYEVLDDNVGYIRIFQFGGNASVLFAKAMGEFADLGVQGVVIDLRDNPGGFMHVVVEMLDMLLPEGTLVYTEDKYGNRDTEYSDAANIDMEFTVIVNGNTASAAEIFAGAMQDYDYCEVVGTTTYGKGVVQAVLPMPESGGGVKITMSEYFTPDGRSIHGNGVQPDIVVEVDESGEDVQLSKAIEVLQMSIN